MWKEIPKGTRYISNKIMGDGFGFSRAELSAMERQQFLIGEISQEDSMIIGSFHNGPLSAVRFVGIVGMLLLLCPPNLFRGFRMASDPCRRR